MIRRPENKNQNGNVFLVLFGGIAVLGLLGVTVTSFMKGPMSSAMKLTRANTAQVQMALASQSSIMAATNTGTAGDCDGDGYIEPMEWRIDATKPKPTGGNLLPANLGVPTIDGWGSDYGYCVWDHGPTTLNAACEQSTPGTDKRLAGTNSKKYPVVAVISAGPDKVFNSTCRTFAAADVNSNGVLGDTADYALAQKDAVTGDDLIFTYTYEEASSASGGLWTLKSSDMNTAIIPKKIEAQDAKFTGTSTVNSLGAPPPPSADCTGLGAAYYNDIASGHCYFKGATNLNWTNAQAACNAAGGYLAVISSAAENDLIPNVTSAATNWIGGGEVGVEGDWKWLGGEMNNLPFWSGGTAGSAVSGRYENWNGSSPTTNASLNYVAYDLPAKTWHDGSGSSAVAYVCEKEPIYQADCSGLGSSYYNDPSTGHCYYLSSATANTRDDASSACIANSAYLATITSSTENTNVTNLTIPTRAYTGASDSAVEGDWRFIGGEEEGSLFWQGTFTGSAQNGYYNNWNTNEPSGSAGEHCQVIVTSGKLQDYSCTTAQYYVCERSPSGQSVEFSNGLKLADDTVVTTCNSTNTGVIRRKSTGMEICDGTSWIAQSAGAMVDDLSDAFTDYANYNFYLGESAGNFAAPAGYGNAGVGMGGVMQALYSGGFNSGLGYQTFGMTTSGWGNTAIGALAMSDVLIGDRNTALGYGACKGSGAVLVSSNKDNTCIGWRTAESYASSGVTLVGANAGRLNEGDTRLTAIGVTAAANNRGGMDNTAIGRYALATINNANNNTAVGAEALYTAQTAANNTAVGFQAMKSRATSDVVTAIGSGAGYAMDGPGTLAGYQAGYNGAPFTNYTALGHKSFYGRPRSSVGVGSNSGFATGTSAGPWNVLVGAYVGNTRAGNSIAMTGIGYNALNGSGYTNGTVAVGTDVLKNFAGAQNTTGMGYQALLNQTSTNGGITAFGYQTLYSSTTGDGKTAIGHQALYNTGTAAQVTAAGYQALYNGTGSNNTALGYQSLYGLTTGTDNSAAGYQALYMLQTGTGNTAVGFQSLYNNNNSNNVGVGYMAGYVGTATQSTVNVGYRAGYTNQTSFNTFVGADSGYAATTGASNTAVGYRSMLSASLNTFSQTAIGYNAFAQSTFTISGTPAPQTMGVAFGAGAGEYSGANSLTLAGAFAGNMLDYTTTVAGGVSTAVGAGSMRWAMNNGTSTIGTAAGFQALHSGRTASGTAAGAQALFNSNGPSTNVALGYRALYSNVSSSFTTMTAIGSRAMYSSLGASNALVIGYNADTAGTNTVRLGNTDVTLIEGTVAFSSTSDKRLKKDIKPSDLGLDFILGLKPVSYRLKQGNGRVDYGFLAQDIDSLLYRYGHKGDTNMITRLPDKMKTYQLRSADLIAPLTKAIQERQVKIDALKRELEELKKNEPISCEGEGR